MLESVLESSGFNLYETDIWSYNGCTKVDTALVLAEFIKKHSPATKIIIHRDDKALRDNPDAKPIFHSDRGYQYTSRVFQSKLQKQGMDQSMSRVGHCIDNGPTEGLWGIIKSEMYCMYKITDEGSLRSAIDNYMKFYAEERPQERFRCKTPSEVRREALSAENPIQYPIAENKRIEAYKAKWCA